MIVPQGFPYTLQLLTTRLEVANFVVLTSVMAINQLVPEVNQVSMTSIITQH